jgi:hypothetical protein
MNFKGEGILPQKDDFLAEQMGRFSEIFGSPIGANDGAPDVVPSKTTKVWFEPPAPALKPVEAVVEKAPPESVEPPVVPRIVSAEAPMDPPEKALAAAPRTVLEYHLIEKVAPDSVELPVVLVPPADPVESDPFPVRFANPGEIEKSSFLGECEALWRHLWERSSD